MSAAPPSTPAEQVLAHMRKAGIEAPPSEIVIDGKIHRFASRPGSKKANGWYIVRPDAVMPMWFFGDWALDIDEKGKAENGALTEQQVR